MNSKLHSICLFVMFFLCVNILTPLTAQAVPAYARQTGQNCVACHAGGQFPELTPYGRTFKLTGYTIGSRAIPLSAMGVASYTKTLKPTDDPAFAKDASVIFQTGSVFLAGKITDNIGIFGQYTYENYGGDTGFEGVWSSDNLDMRFADHIITPGNDFIYGFTLNNNPTVSDVWNTAPAWIGYVPTAFGVTGPDAEPIVAGLGAQVVGITAYGMWNNLLYAEVGGYQTANGVWSFLSHGVSNAEGAQLKGTNPYLRLALTREWGPHNAMVGVFGLNADVYPDPLAPTGPTIQYQDRGIDAQYQYLLDPHSVTAQFSYVHEDINNGIATGIATNDTNTLKALRLKGSYIYQAKYGASLSYFRTTGSSDSTLYPDSATFSPTTQGWTPEIFWMPDQHVRVGLQYYAYQTFDGANTNYDGNGRDARDNNTAFLYLWGAF